MSQNDFNVANQTFPNTRVDLNAAFQALASSSGGASAPSTTYAGQIWHDTTNDLLKIRNKANSAFITVAKFDTSNDRWEIRSNIIQASSAAGITLKNAAGTTILSVSDAGVVTTIGNVVVVGDVSVTGTVDGVDIAAEETRLQNTSGTNTGDEILATTTAAGIVEKATTAEAEAGTEADKFPDVVKVKKAIEALAPQSGLVFISSTDLSGDATADFTGFDASKYDSYIFEFLNVKPSSDGAILRMLTSTNGGSGYDGGSTDYRWAFTGRNTTSGAEGDGSNGTTSITLADSVGNAGSEYGVSGRVLVHGPHLVKHTYITGNLYYHTSISFGMQSNVFGAARMSAADVDAVRFLFSSGNLSNGTITMYGVKNA